MKDYFCAEWLKQKHSPWRILLFLMPLFCVVFSAALTYEYFAVDGYNWWYITIYPATIALLCGMIGMKDKKKKNVTIWSLPGSMGRIWDAKIITGILYSAVAMAVVTVFIFGMQLFMESQRHMAFLYKPPVLLQLVASILIWLTSLWQIPFCLWLSQKMGLFFMLVFHIGTYSVAATTISLTSWFAVFPQAITSRLMCAVLGVLPNGLLAMEGQMTYTPELVEGRWLLAGIPAALVWFTVFWLAGRKWFERQVERQ